MNNLKCPKCQQPFDKLKKLPRILPNCGHTFCLKCLNNDVEKNQKVKCFKCEFVYDTKDLSRFPVNEMIFGFLEDNPSKNKFCKKHDKIEEYFCIDDNESVCASCVIHGTHKEHNILTLNEIQKFTDQNLIKTEKQFKGIKVTQSIDNLKEFASKLKEKNMQRNKQKIQKNFTVNQKGNFLNNKKKTF